MVNYEKLCKSRGDCARSSQLVTYKNIPTRAIRVVGRGGLSKKRRTTAHEPFESISCYGELRWSLLQQSAACSIDCV